jgi:hypothetical protein
VGTGVSSYRGEMDAKKSKMTEAKLGLHIEI